MLKNKTRFPLSLVVAVALAVILAVAACSGSDTFEGNGAKLDVSPTEDGFAFANFGERDTDEYLNGADLALMFGASACVDEVTDPCRPIAEAAAWAMMVNNARTSGHCEGFAVQSALRFDEKAEPKTISLDRDRKVTHSLIRAFATQFLPDVQAETNKWAMKSLKEKVEALVESFGGGSDSDVSQQAKEGQAKFTAGLYSDAGGHALLPYAVQYLTTDLAKISVLDSNWPERDRYIKVDLAANKWYFSMWGEDPENDPDEWSGGPRDFDLTPRDVRLSSVAPFGDGASRVAGSILVIRSATPHWSIKTANGEFSPIDGEQIEGITARPIRGAPTKLGAFSPTEYTVLVDTDEIELLLPNETVAFVANDAAVTAFATKGSNDEITISNEKVTAGASVDIKVASEDKLVAVSANNPVIEITEEKLTAEVVADNGQVIIQAVDETTTTAEIVVTDEQVTVVTVEDEVATHVHRRCH